MSMPFELALIVEELRQPAQPSDMHRRAALCQQALSLAKRDQYPHVWASLQAELAMSLAQDAIGARADNLERAIQHCEEALLPLALRFRCLALHLSW